MSFTYRDHKILNSLNAESISSYKGSGFLIKKGILEMEIFPAGDKFITTIRDNNRYYITDGIGGTMLDSIQEALRWYHIHLQTISQTAKLAEETYALMKEELIKAE